VAILEQTVKSVELIELQDRLVALEQTLHERQYEVDQ
jgi:hypothetical protein